MRTMRYPFTQADAQAAFESWGCNCGPAALAFALQLPLDAARDAIDGFEQKRYTSPTMMKNAVNNLGREMLVIKPACGDTLRDEMFADIPALVRIQWCGPWTAKGSNPRWAYGYTHWIAAWNEGPSIEAGVPLVFDINCGILGVETWEDLIVPMLIPKRGDGQWFPTHVWRLPPVREAVNA
ncbi:MAG: hypothetical protein H6826_14495 [Planctomycetes bacterium]|nr:hypothetical protein [Planctomycetota bacterium]